MREKMGCVYIEFKNKGVIRHKEGADETILFSEYRRILKEIKKEKKVIELEKDHLISPQNIVEIFIRHD